MFFFQLLEELEELDKIVIWPKRGSNLLLVSLLPKLLTKPVCFAIKYVFHRELLPIILYLHVLCTPFVCLLKLLISF